MEWRRAEGGEDHSRDALDYMIKAKEIMMRKLGTGGILTRDHDVSGSFEVQMVNDLLYRNMKRRLEREQRELEARRVAYYTGRGHGGTRYCCQPLDFYVPLNQWDKYE